MYVAPCLMVALFDGRDSRVSCVLRDGPDATADAKRHGPRVNQTQLHHLQLHLEKRGTANAAWGLSLKEGLKKVASMAAVCAQVLRRAAAMEILDVLVVEVSTS